MKNIKSALIQISKIQIVENDKISNPIDILINEGRIEQIADTIQPIQNAYQINGAGKFISIGWLDLRAICGEPGLEYKETLSSISKCALAGGFTSIALHSNTENPIHSKENVIFIINNSKEVNFYPIAALSNHLKGAEMNELIDLSTFGSLGFSDAEQPITNTTLLIRALRYLNQIGLPLFNIAADKDLIKGGLMHEGEMSTYLGLKASPHLAETLAIQKDLSVLKFAGGYLHFSLLSTAEGVEMIREAKKNGLKVTADVAAYQLDLTDQKLADFDTNCKVFPPLREENDRIALIEGIKDGTIDAIVSNHIAQDIEGKRLEFDMAENGMIGLQTAFSTAIKHLSVTDWVRSVTQNSNKILSLPEKTFKVGEKINFTIFDTTTSWTFSKANNFSKSQNSPYLNQEMIGKVCAVYTDSNELFEF